MPILLDPCMDPRWDAFVEAYPFGWVTHLSAWKKVLESSFPHVRGHYLALTDGHGRIEAGLPLFEVRSPILGTRVVSIPFATLSDPLVVDRAELSLLLDQAVGLARYLRASKIEIRAHGRAPVVRDGRLRQSRAYVSHCLVLDRPLEDLFKTFHLTRVRQVIRKAARLSLEKKTAETFDDIERFYGLYVSTRKRLGVPPQPPLFFKALWRSLGPSGRVEFLLALENGKPVGGIMLLKYKDRVSWEAMGVREQYRPLGVSHFLVWEAIQEAHCEGRAVFDFGRTAADNEGLLRFKSRWGTKEVDLPQYFFSLAGGARHLGLGPRSMHRLRRLCSLLPSPLFVALGKAGYRHMG